MRLNHDEMAEHPSDQGLTDDGDLDLPLYGRWHKNESGRYAATNRGMLPLPYDTAMALGLLSSRALSSMR